MSDEPSPLFFSAEDLMPSWAQAKSDKPAETARETRAPREREDERRGGGDRGGRGGARDDRGGPRGDRRGGGGGAGFRSDRGGERGAPGREGQRGGGAPRGDGDRRTGGGDRRGGGGDRRGGGGDRPFRGRDERPPQDRPRQDVLPTGIKATLEPTGAAVQGLAKHIRESGRVFPVSDLAKVVLQSRDRYQLVLQAEEGLSLFRCQVDGSLWLTREEAFNHLLQGPALEEYYVIEDVSVDPPSGNFSTIAVCGMSGVILGPPNHHEYQRNILRLHGERFSNMSLERYKARIEMQSGEEVVEKWKEQVSRVRQYRVRTAEDAIVAAPAEAVADEPVIAEDANDGALEDGAVAVEETIAAESSAEEMAPDPADEVETAVEEVAEAPEASGDEEAEATEAGGEAPAPAPVRDGLVFKNLAELSKHFRETFAAAAVWEQSKAVIPGNISFKLLSPGLQTLVRNEGENARRGFPIAMMQTLCRELEKVGLKFFKVGKKALHVGLVRPKSLDQSAVLTDAIKLILDHVAAHPKCTVVSLLEALVPDFKRPEAGDEATELPEAARLVLRDQRWLTAEGYLLEFPDTTLRLGRLAPLPESGDGVKPIAVKQPKKKVARPAKAEVAPAVDSSPIAESDEAEGVVEEEEIGIDLPEFANEAEEDALPESVDPVEVL